MSVPLPGDSGAAAWITLTSEQKRARVLDVAGELFAREGVEFPMPELAKAVGVGVGSLYRQIGKKEDVVAALIVARLGALEARYRAAAGTGDDPMRALHGVITETVDECVHDRVTKMCWEYGPGRQDCEQARAGARDALQHLIDSAQHAGALRDDASGNDLRFLFRAAREAEKIMPGGAQRLGELVLAGLARR